MEITEAVTKTKSQDGGLRGAAKREAFHRQCESRIGHFEFQRPDNLPGGRKASVYLAGTDILNATIQVIPEGGDNNLHYHPGADGFWMPLQGRVRFYGPDGAIGEYGPYQGVVMPRNARYWFETADPTQELHLLHVSAHTQENVKNTRIAVAPDTRGYRTAVRVNHPASMHKGNRINKPA